MSGAAQGNAVVFDTFVGLHVASALLGFGSVALDGVYGAIARRPGRPGTAEETARYFGSGGRMQLLLLAVPVFGAVALAFRPQGAGFGQVWVIIGFLAWAAAAALLLGFVRPAERRLSCGADDTARLGRRVMWAAAGCDALFVVALAVMITQPP